MAFNTAIESSGLNRDDGADAVGSSPARPPETTASMERSSEARRIGELKGRHQATEFFGDCLLFMAQAIKSGAAGSALKETIRALRRRQR